MSHLCINCNSPEVARTGDDFACGKCGFKWDVAHEQASAAYLRMKGRTPAKSLEELAAEEVAARQAARAELETGQPSNTDGGANEPENQPASTVSTELPTAEAGDSTEESNKKAKKG